MTSKPTKWIQKGLKRPGALTQKAKKAGQTPMAFAKKHYHDKDLTGKQARYAVNANKGNRNHG